MKESSKKLPTLPMTVFEEYMLLDGTSAYPMECHSRFRFSGGFDHDLFERALADKLAENPFLYACARETKLGRYAWEIPEFGPNLEDRVSHVNPDFTQVMGIRVYWLTGSCRGDYPKETRELLDIFSEGMTRLYITEEKAQDGTVLRTDLVIKCHHSASDGKGMNNFIETLLLEYAQRLGISIPDNAIPRPKRIESLANRHLYGRTFWERFKILMICIAHLPRSLRLIGHGVQPIANHLENDAEIVAKMERPVEGFPKVRFRRLNPETTKRILTRCREKKITFNDAMLQAVWVGTKSWRQKHPEVAYSGKNQWIRIAVPTNLRHPSQTDMPACNVVSMLFCDRKECDIDVSERFRAGITREMNYVKKYSLGFLLIQSLKDARNFCGNLKGAVKMRSCWSSMVLTNIGPVFSPKTLTFPRTETGKLQIGNLILDEIEGCSPIRSQTNLSICCITYAGAMNLTLIYDHRLLSAEQADSYFTEVLNSLEEILK